MIFDDTVFIFVIKIPISRILFIKNWRAQWRKVFMLGSEKSFACSLALLIVSIIFVEKDLRNLELYRKKKLNHQLKSKNSFTGKSKYLIY